MAVPAPSIAPTLQPGATNIGRYIGTVNAVGLNATLNIDLKFLSKYLRESSNMRENMRITVESKDANVTCPNPGNVPNVAFFSTPGEVNEYVQIQVSSVTGDEVVIVQVEQIHTVIR